MRTRALTCVFTRSCQFTAVFAAAGMVLPLRAMFAAGMNRDTSPACCPAACGAAQLLPGMAINQESRTATPRAHGDFFVIFRLSSRAHPVYLSRSEERRVGKECRFRRSQKA